MTDRLLHELAAALHGFYYIDIAGAAAEVAFEPVIDLLVRGPRIVLEHCGNGHDHPRGAESALQGVTVGERLLHRVQFAVFGKAFDRDDFSTARLDSKHGA